MNQEPAGYFHYAWGDFVQPYQYSSVCGANNAPNIGAGFWTGIGGYGNSDLGQNGTIMGGVGLASGLGQNQAWFETDEGTLHPISLFATPGQQFAANVFYGYISWAGWTGYEYYFANLYTGATATWAQQDNNFNGSTTDFIVEAPNGGVSGGVNLANFRTFTAVFDSSAKTNNPISYYPNVNITMRDPSNNLQASTSGLGSSGHSFSVTQHSCQ